MLNEADIDFDGARFTCTADSAKTMDYVRTASITLKVCCSLDKFRRSLALAYLAQPEIPEDTWPPVGSKKYINLALIKRSIFVNYGSEYA